MCTITSLYISLILLGALWWSQVTAGSLDREALEEGRRQMSRVYQVCGDSHYYHYLWLEQDDWRLTEMKGLTLGATPTLTEADRLNQLEWKGTIDIRARVCRAYWSRDRQWSLWKDLPPKDHVERIDLIKKGGQWQRVFSGADHWRQRLLPSCQKIAQVGQETTLDREAIAEAKRRVASHVRPCGEWSYSVIQEGPGRWKLYAYRNLTMQSYPGGPLDSPVNPRQWEGTVEVRAEAVQSHPIFPRGHVLNVWEKGAYHWTAFPKYQAQTSLIRFHLEKRDGRWSVPKTDTLASPRSGRQ